MKKIFFSLLVLMATVFSIGYGYALYTDTVSADDNQFYAGLYDVQLSVTDADGDNIAEPNLPNWAESQSGVWTTSLQWLPGETISSKIFIRNRGEVDTERLLWTITGRGYYGSQQLDQAVNLVEAWYDRDADGVAEAGEDLLPDLISQFDADSDGQLTLAELYDGVDTVHGGTAYDLEAGAAILPGKKTDGQIGGYTGTGKGLFLTWQFDPEASVNYQDAWVKVDFDFIGEQATS